MCWVAAARVDTMVTGEETELRVSKKFTLEKMIQQDFKDVLFQKFRYEVEERDGRKSEAAEEGKF